MYYIIVLCDPYNSCITYEQANAHACTQMIYPANTMRMCTLYPTLWHMYSFQRRTELTKKEKKKLPSTCSFNHAWCIIRITWAFLLPLCFSWDRLSQYNTTLKICDRTRKKTTHTHARYTYILIYVINMLHVLYIRPIVYGEILASMLEESPFHYIDV